MTKDLLRFKDVLKLEIMTGAFDSLEVRLLKTIKEHLTARFAEAIVASSPETRAVLERLHLVITEGL